MILKDYLDIRAVTTYTKKLRILDYKTRKNCGKCIYNFDAEVVSLKSTKKYLFVFIKNIDKI